jgi:hypothetical protein
MTKRLDWAISRMQNLFAIWDEKLDRIDKEFCLRRIRDREPDLFWKIADEKAVAKSFVR